MTTRIIKILQGFVFVAAILIVTGTGFGSDIVELEKKLESVSGEKQLEVLEQLVENYKNNIPPKALNYGKQALQLLTELKLKGDIREIRLLSNMSYCFSMQGDYKSAKEYANRSLLLAFKRKDRTGVADAYMNIGYIEWFLGNYIKSKEYYNRAYKIYLDTNDQKNIIAYTFRMSRLYWKLGDFPQALEYGYNTLIMSEKYGFSDEEIEAKNIIGVIYWETKEYEKGLEIFREVLAYHEKKGDIIGQAKANNNIGLTLKYLGRYDESLVYLKRAAELNRKLDNRHYMSNTTNNIGEVYAALNQHSKALEFYKQSLIYKEVLKDLRGISYTRSNMGLSYLALKEYSQAQVQFQEAFSIAEKIGSKNEAVKALRGIAETFESRGSYKEALSFYKKYKEYNDLFFNEQNRHKIAKMQSTYELEKKEKEIALLVKDNQIQNLMLNRSTNIRNTFILISFIIFLAAFFLYARNRLKSKINRSLTKEVEDHRQTAHLLKESEEKFRSLAEKTVLGISIIQDGVIQYVNPRFAEIFQYSMEELIGSDPLTLISENDRKTIEKDLKALLNENDPIEPSCVEFQGLTAKGKTVFLEIYGVKILYRDRPALLETIIDISEKKRVESELARSQKLESIGILAGGIAHDFNNLLTIIIGNISMVLDELVVENIHTRMLDAALRASNQATELSKKLVTFAGGVWLDMEKLDFTAILKDTIEFYSENNSNFRNISIDSNLKPIIGDGRKIRQVLSNIIQNALEASRGDADPLWIDITATGLFFKEDNRFALKQGDYIKLSIKDNGKGIPPQSIGKIFDPYFSTKNNVTQKGMGLGLAICYSIVRKHNGHIIVESEINKGTTVEIYLPACMD